MTPSTAICEFSSCAGATSMATCRGPSSQLAVFRHYALFAWAHGAGPRRGVTFLGPPLRGCRRTRRRYPLGPSSAWVALTRHSAGSLNIIKNLGYQRGDAAAAAAETVPSQRRVVITCMTGKRVESVSMIAAAYGLDSRRGPQHVVHCPRASDLPTGDVLQVAA